MWYYLVGDSEPIGSLSTSEPPDIPLPNYDPERDSEPGLLLKKTDGGAGETEATKYQQWEVAAPPGEVTISPVVFWAAVKDFDSEKTGRLGVYLLDCAASCEVIETVYQSVSGAAWSRLSISFSGSHTFAVGRRLALKVVVQADSDDEMWLAYGTWDHDAYIRVLASNVPTTTTTTTPPTTTTTTPPTTTTTTLQRSTSSTSSTTTTIGPLSSPTTTTTTAPPPTTTTTVGSPESGSDQTVTTGGPVDPNLPPPPENPGVVISDRIGMATAITLATALSPLEGLQVAFSAAVQIFATNFLQLLALLLVGGLLFLARLSDDENLDSRGPVPGS